MKVVLDLQGGLTRPLQPLRFVIVQVADELAVTVEADEAVVAVTRGVVLAGVGDLDDRAEVPRVVSGLGHDCCSFKLIS